MRVSHWGQSSYINLPLFFPSGTAASVRISKIGNTFRVDDSGFAFREIETIGFDRSFPKIAARLAGVERLSTDRRVIYTDTDEAGLYRAICDVGFASHAVVSEIYSRAAEDESTDVEDYLRERLESIFGSSHVEPEKDIIGASSHAWKVSATLHLPSGLTVFQAVGTHAYSVYKASTAFHDLNGLPTPPRCVAVVKDKEAMGVNLNMLAQAGRVIQGDQTDDAYRAAAA